jgi:hypothetical protein
MKSGKFAAPVLALLLAACATAAPVPGPRGALEAQQTEASFLTIDTTLAQYVPAGFGTLRQDDIAMKLTLPRMQVRLVPLDEGVIRLLAPDSYKALHDLLVNNQERISAVIDRYRLRQPSLWYLSFFGIQPDSRFDPTNVVIATSTRELKPLEIIPLTPGFGEQRLNQREVQSAIIVMEDQIDLTQPISLRLEGLESRGWEQSLRAIERERALARSRASSKANAGN